MRDIKKDLELCQRATPGPWYREKTDANFNGFPLEYVIADTAPCTTGGKVYAQPEEGSFPSSDADFIAEAREGWPEAIQRAMEAEKSLRTCQQIGRKYEVAVCELIKKLTVKCPYDYGEGCPLGVNNDCDKDDRHLCWQQILRTKARESNDK